MHRYHLKTRALSYGNGWTRSETDGGIGVTGAEAHTNAYMIQKVANVVSMIDTMTRTVTEQFRSAAGLHASPLVATAPERM